MKTADDVIVKNLGLVRKIARGMLRRGTGSDVESLISAGTLGLIEGAAAFDPKRGFRLSTFVVPRIRGAMLDDIRSNGPRRRAEMDRRRSLAAAEATAEQKHLARAGVREIAAQLGVTVDRVWALRDRNVEMLRLDDVAAASDHRAVPATGLLADPRSQTFESALETAELVDRALAALPVRERAVVVAYYLEGKPYLEIGRTMGITESMVCRICRTALVRMRAAIEELVGDAEVLR